MSITFTALIWTGILLSIFGAIVTVLGLGGSTLFEVSIGSVTVKMKATGLIIIVIGAALSFFTAQNLPPDVIVLGDEPTLMEKNVRNIPAISLLVCVIAIFLLLFQF